MSTPTKGTNASRCLLTYTTHCHPDPLQAATTGAVDITVTNRSPGAVTCQQITVAVPVGEGPSDLTNFPGNIETLHPNSWTFDRQDESGQFIASPQSPKAAHLAVGDQLTFTLSQIAVNARIGRTKLTIDEQTASGEAKQALPLDKVPQGFEMSDFQPDKIGVTNGCPVTLTWRGTQQPEATYSLTYDDITPINVTNLRRWESPKLHHDTVFLLTLHAKQGGDSVTHTLTAAVTVAHPNLRVQDLTVNGAVSLLTRQQPIAADARTGPYFYTAEVDGIITGWVQTAHNDSPATLKVVTTPPDGITRITSAQCRQAPSPTQPNTQETLLVPVPRGTHVYIVKKCDRDDFQSQLTWLPFGIGRLTPTTATTMAR